MRCAQLVLALLLGTLPTFSQNIITTVAGTTWQFQDNGQRALNAQIGEITGLAFDPDGNVVATDATSSVVLKIDATGIVTVIAGNGLRGFSGDGGPATQASLLWPNGVAFDATGNLYFCDPGNDRIRRVDKNGIITTVAGGGSSLGDGGPATGAHLAFPRGIAFDSGGNFYIADSFNDRVRKVTPAGVITTIAGNGIRSYSGDGGPATRASLNLPHAVTADRAGNLYIGDEGNQRIRVVSPSGTIRTFAGNGVYQGATTGDGGPATLASFSPPVGLAFDVAGNLYFTDWQALVRKVDTNGIIWTVAGTPDKPGFAGDGGPATRARLNMPEAIAVDRSGNVYVGDQLNFRIRKISADGTISTFAGTGSVKFGGDGQLATDAFLNSPDALALDSRGNVYIADTRNNRIRKVSADGTITTIAGNGVWAYSADNSDATSMSLMSVHGVAVDPSGNVVFTEHHTTVRQLSSSGVVSTIAGQPELWDFNGDGGPATSAALGGVAAVASDRAGNIYVASEQHRVRKITTGGKITTIAGNGIQGFSGDGGPATAASLNTPIAVAVDASGNVFVSDSGNVRIRKIAPDGTITTFAGNGTEGYSGDGGPATRASLTMAFICCLQLATDAAGNLYIADHLNNRIRKVTPAGIIDTAAGGGGCFPEKDGGPAKNAGICTPHGVAVDPTGNIYIADSGNDRIRLVPAAAPTFATNTLSIAAAVQAGTRATFVDKLSVSSSVMGLYWQAQAVTDTGGDWLSLSAETGYVPNAPAFTVDATSLTSGTYRGRITFRVAGATTPTLTVTINLTVTQGPAPLMVANPAALVFSVPANAGAPSPQMLGISNAGAGKLDWSATVTTNSGGAWLSVNSASGTTAAGAPATLSVSANASGLKPGTYFGAIKLHSDAASQDLTVPVILIVSDPLKQTILLSQTGFDFTGVAGGRSVPADTLGVLNYGQGVMNWTVTATTSSGGNWLSVTPTRGSSDGATLQVSNLSVQVRVIGLAPGEYNGAIQIDAPGADNSPQYAVVNLTVLPRGSQIGPVVRPSGLVFAGPAGGSSPSSQAVRIATGAMEDLDVVTGMLTFDGGSWLDSVPRNFALMGGGDKSMTVQPALGSLESGIYRGAITLLFSDGQSQAVNVLFVVAPSSAVFSAGYEPLGIRPMAVSGCTPRKLLVVPARGTANRFEAVIAALGKPLEVVVTDDCGTPVKNATVTASFSNGEPALTLTDMQNGIYSATWRAPNPAAQVGISFTASKPGLAVGGGQVQSQVASSTAPVVFAGGVVSAASLQPKAPLAPGSIVSIFGGKQATATAVAKDVPLPTTLAGASVTVGGKPAPLFFASDGQINAQLPFDLPPNSRQQLVLTAQSGWTNSKMFAVPETITIAAAQPAIFTTNSQGTGQGSIVDVNWRIVDTTNPAKAGNVVQAFGTGFGATSPAVAAGAAAPSAEPLALVTIPMTATIGGKPATVRYAGLAPGYAGLYQVNVQVPDGVAPGSAVTLVLYQNAVASNTVTLAIR